MRQTYRNTVRECFRLGSKVNLLVFSVDENQTAVGTINEPLATSFSITQGGDDFTVSNAGVIEFISAPDYEVQNYYTLRVLSNKGRRYYIKVNVLDVASDFELLTGTQLLLNTAM